MTQAPTPKRPRGTIAARKKAFLTAYRELGNVSASADAVGMARDQHYDWLAKDPAYVQEFASAKETAADRLEQEARRRAAEGVDEPVYQGGKLVGTVRKYSDTLLIFLLKGARPEKFRDNLAVQHSGAGGGPIEVKKEGGDDYAGLFAEVLALAGLSTNGNGNGHAPAGAAGNGHAH